MRSPPVCYRESLGSRWRWRVEHILSRTIWIGRLHLTWLGLWRDEPHRWRPEIGWHRPETDPFGGPFG